jgi:hypothetical protein
LARIQTALRDKHEVAEAAIKQWQQKVGVTGWRPMKHPAVPEADFAVHASVYGELLIKTNPEAERLIDWRRAT